MRRPEAIDAILRDRIVTLELMDFFLGKYIGHGASRHVFEYKADKKWVVKLDCSTWNANVEEFKVWKTVEFTKHAKWFAPIGKMSACGRIMLMRKCEPLVVAPKRIPSFFNDIKRDNWGTLNGQPVCLDYGINDLTKFGLNVNSFKTPNW